ncbi:hypothetical protein VITFI_CDS0553 [Vitreoscilla filiformis]|uniref:Uncharacterized protein n=1 Tax=Vitreoscilla filiformis TaxID=63 RepID=A0A221KBC3_VITFI|nr:hypothetical protein [Vitreoscilla filiformis]ASM76332.1 hypothetical protein VITFI_CDS0553 [Vitreoscilla filiformis]
MEPLPLLDVGSFVGFVGQASGGDVEIIPPCPANDTPPPGRADAGLLALVAWTDADMRRFMRRMVWLQRLRGLSAKAAEGVAEKLTQRDRSGDDRRLCVECQHHSPGRCRNHRAAGLNSGELAPDLAALWQRCGGFADLEPNA